MDPGIPGFNPDEVRAGLTLAMNIGLPVNMVDRPTFVFPAPITPTTDTRDSEGVPMSWRAGRARTGVDTTYQVPCGIEARDRDGQVTNFGSIAPYRVALTLLDRDYSIIKGFSYCVIAGVKYTYSATEPPLGLVSVGIWVIHCTSDDEG